MRKKSYNECYKEYNFIINFNEKVNRYFIDCFGPGNPDSIIKTRKEQNDRFRRGFMRKKTYCTSHYGFYHIIDFRHYAQGTLMCVIATDHTVNIYGNDRLRRIGYYSGYNNEES